MAARPCSPGFETVAARPPQPTDRWLRRDEVPSRNPVRHGRPPVLTRFRDGRCATSSTNRLVVDEGRSPVAKPGEAWPPARAHRVSRQAPGRLPQPPVGSTGTHRGGSRWPGRGEDWLMTFSDPVSTQDRAPGPVPAQTGEPTLGALVHDLSQQIPDLIRSELRLAQAEVAEKGKRAGLGIGMFSAAGLLAFFGVAALLTTVVLALDLVMPAWL